MQMDTILLRAPWRVVEARPLSGYRVSVRFTDGVTGVVDLSRLVTSTDAGVFSALRDEEVFRQVRLELGVVTWPGDIDLAPDAMHEAIKQKGEWVVS